MNNIIRIIITLQLTLIFTYRSFANPILVNKLSYDNLSEMSDRVIMQARFSPDGSKIITGGTLNDAYIWDTNSGEIILTLKGHRNFVSAVEFSPDGSKAITGSWEQTTKIWNVKTGELIRTLGEYKATGGGHIYGVGLSSDNKLAAVFQEDKGIIVWDANNKIILKQHPIYSGGKNKLIFSPDKKYLLMKNTNYGGCVLLDTERGIKDNFPLYDMQFVNTSTVITIESDMNLPYHYYFRKRDYPSFNIKVDLGDIYLGESNLYQTLSLNQNILIINKRHESSEEKKKTILDFIQLNTKEKLCTFIPSFTPKGDYPYMRAIQFSPDGKRFLGIQGDTVYIYDISNITSSIPNAATHK